jgi:argininosuccinate lyase
VLQGVPFREAHHVVGALVRMADERDVQLGDLSDEALVSVHPKLAEIDRASALDPRRAVERRSLIGGPAQARVEGAIAHARARWLG